MEKYLIRLEDRASESIQLEFEPTRSVLELKQVLKQHEAFSNKLDRVPVKHIKLYALSGDDSTNKQLLVDDELIQHGASDANALLIEVQRPSFEDKQNLSGLVRTRHSLELKIPCKLGRPIV